MKETGFDELLLAPLKHHDEKQLLTDVDESTKSE